MTQEREVDRSEKRAPIRLTELKRPDEALAIEEAEHAKGGVTVERYLAVVIIADEDDCSMVSARRENS